ncbi:UNVERIFIED_ORG: putative zinc-type alcohol dehydrogenase-like protein [Burkholderia sp. CF145]
MLTINARCTCGPREPFKAFKVARRELGPHDVLIDIAYAGICHSDIDHAHSTRGKTIYPLVPGHEIAGIVSAVGSSVTKFAVGDRAGVGCMVDSCRECPECLEGLEQYCRGKRVMTYNSIGRDGDPTYGGYSEKIVVHEDFVLRIPEGIPLQEAAPLFCAGITLYSPLRHWGAGPGKRVAIVGFGGLGHVGVKISHALGAHTTVLDLSLEKRDDGMRMGADDFRATTDPVTFTGLANSIDLIISTVPGNLDMNAFLGLLRRDGTFVNLGVPEKPLNIDAIALLRNRRSIAGTLSGGLPETQEMIDFCASHGIGAEVEVISADRIDEAYRRLIAGDVRYRFVIDISTMANVE